MMETRMVCVKESLDDIDDSNIMVHGVAKNQTQLKS